MDLGRDRSDDLSITNARSAHGRLRGPLVSTHYFAARAETTSGKLVHLRNPGG